MKTTVTRKVTEEVEIKFVEINIPMDEITEHDPQLPGILFFGCASRGDMWRIKVDVDTGKVIGWPDGAPAFELYAKPSDSGVYRLLGADEKVIASIEHDYVPNRLIPGSYGDYVELNFSGDGTITNWPKRLDVSEFFKTDED